MINTAENDILTKMGFVNIIKIDKIQILMSQICVLEGVPSKNKLKTMAFLPDINDSESLEIPKMYLNHTFKREGQVVIKIQISELYLNFCHDSILGLILFSQGSSSHISEALKNLKKVNESTHKIKTGRDLFGSVIEEVDESDDESPCKRRVNLDSILEENKFHEEYKEPTMEKNLSDLEIQKNYDIINSEKIDLNDFNEGSVEMFDEFHVVEGYLSCKHKVVEEKSKWHSIKMPKTELSSGIYTEEKSIPKLKFSITVKSLEIRIFEGHDFCFESSQIMDKEVQETIYQGIGYSPSKFGEKNMDSSGTDFEDGFDLKKEFNVIEHYYGRKSASISNSSTMVDENKGRVRLQKRLSKRYFQFLMQKMEFSYLDLENSIEKIDSQIGFSVEKLNINEIRSKTEIMKILWFDNDLDNYKNIGLKIITLANTPAQNLKNEKCIEFYFKSEFIKISLNHVTVTFAYLIVQPILIFMETEMTKDEEIIKKAKNPEVMKSIVMDKIEDSDNDSDEEIASSVWKISDTNLEEKTKVYVKYLHIQLCKIKISYKSDNLNIVNLCKGNLQNYMTNLVDIKEMRIKIKEFKI